LESVARKRRISRSEALRLAIAAFVASHEEDGELPGFTGCGASGHRPSLGEDAESLLAKATRRTGLK